MSTFAICVLIFFAYMILCGLHMNVVYWIEYDRIADEAVDILMFAQTKWDNPFTFAAFTLFGPIIDVVFGSLILLLFVACGFSDVWGWLFRKMGAR